ncbi:alcohol dehydrogenase catalytic domain-containing protein [Streptomyces sp. NPDC002920]
MKGYVLHSKSDAAWTEVPVPPLGPYDAMICPTAVTTCTTDAHLIATAALPAAVGKPIGHDGVGVVEEVGHQVKDFRPGGRGVPGGASDWRTPEAQRGEAKYYQGNNPSSSTATRSPSSAAARSASWASPAPRCAAPDGSSRTRFFSSPAAQRSTAC